MQRFDLPAQVFIRQNLKFTELNLASYSLQCLEKYVVKGVTLFVVRDRVALMQTFVCGLLAKEKAENRAMRAMRLYSCKVHPLRFTIKSVQILLKLVPRSWFIDPPLHSICAITNASLIFRFTVFDSLTTTRGFQCRHAYIPCPGVRVMLLCSLFSGAHGFSDIHFLAILAA